MTSSEHRTRAEAANPAASADAEQHVRQDLAGLRATLIRRGKLLSPVLAGGALAGAWLLRRLVRRLASSHPSD